MIYLQTDPSWSLKTEIAAAACAGTQSLLGYYLSSQLVPFSNSDCNGVAEPYNNNQLQNALSCYSRRFVVGEAFMVYMYLTVTRSLLDEEIQLFIV